MDNNGFRRMLPWAVSPLLMALDAALGAYNLCYMEQWHTFVYEKGFVCPHIFRVNGFNYLSALFVTQFFVHPLLAVAVNAGVLTLVYMGIRRYLAAVGGGGALLTDVLPLVVVCMAIPAQHSTNLEYTFTTSLLIVSAMLWILSAISGARARACVLAIMVPAVLMAAGPAALALALLSAFLFSHNRADAGYIAVPLIVWAVSAAVAVRMALVMDISKLATLDMYAISGLWPPSASYVCYGVLLAVAVLSLPVLMRRLDGKWACVAVAVLGIVAALVQRGPANEDFKKLCYLQRHACWDSILDVCRHYEGNVMFHNYRNLALAEKGWLTDSLFQHPNMGLYSMMLQADKSHFLKGMLSDVFFSMGDMSQAQEHAFASMEMTGNTSPKMLERLAYTNIAWGEPDVALRYLRILDRTLFYHERANSIFNGDYPAGLDDLLPLNDSVYGFPGVDAKLRMILRKDPSNVKVAQYLGVLYLLNKDIPQFMDVLREFYGKPCLSSLPLSFRQAVGVYSRDADTLARYGIDAKALSDGPNGYEIYFRTNFQPQR